MAGIRPQIIRADTVDLQDQANPSAKDHSRQPARPAAMGDGPPAPHQANALRSVEHDTAEYHPRSPRLSQDLSNKELQLLADDSDSGNDAGGLAQDLLQRNANAGGTNGMDGDSVDGDGEDGMDDDMMDKISSSPSIEDDVVPESPSVSTDEAFSSSPFLESPAHFPLVFPRTDQGMRRSEDHHRMGEYGMEPQKRQFPIAPHSKRDCSTSPSHIPQSASSQSYRDSFQDQFSDMEESFDEDDEYAQLHDLLLPTSDSLLDNSTFLDNSFDDADISASPIDHGPSSEISGLDPDFDESVEVTEDDETEDISFSDDSRFVDSGWGGECLRETEDIDFELVYALHTFVATVEGQANATKGENMVLLDDSNSYWWLVRVLRDGSIGYLPAEHIETPTERLARLNKHRNIDLSQTMLGDSIGKSKNKLPIVLKRKAGRTVQFSAPTFYEPPEQSFSSDEDDDGSNAGSHAEEAAEQQTTEEGKDVDDNAVVEPLKAGGSREQQAGQTISMVDSSADERIDGIEQNGYGARETNSEDAQVSEEGTSPRSRKGTVRNTDSFFKDDTVETRKINLTPSLLREDSSSSTSKSFENRELKTRESLESLDKSISNGEKGKDDKKRKEKKGMLSGLFKRKDKKGRVQEEEVEDEKISGELSRSSLQGKESSESLRQEQQRTQKPQRQTSKLQKQPPMKPAGAIQPTNTRQNVVSPKPEPVQPLRQQQRVISPPPAKPAPSLNSLDTPRQINHETPQQSMYSAPQNAQNESTNVPLSDEPPPEDPFEDQPQPDSPKEAKRGVFTPIRDALLPSSMNPTSDLKPEKLHKAKQRMALDDFDYSADENEPVSPMSPVQQPAPLHFNPPPQRAAPTIQQVQLEEPDQERLDRDFSPDATASPSHTPMSTIQQERLFLSPPPTSQPPPLDPDTSSASTTGDAADPVSPISTSSASSALGPSSSNVPHNHITSPSTSSSFARDRPSLREETPASTTSTTNPHEHAPPSSTHSSTAPTWSDASLRAYMEDESEVRDLLLIVHDKSDVKQIKGRGREHPICRDLFREEDERLREIEKRLDGMLGDFWARKRRGQGVSRVGR